MLTLNHLKLELFEDAVLYGCPWAQGSPDFEQEFLPVFSSTHLTLSCHSQPQQEFKTVLE